MKKFMLAAASLVALSAVPAHAGSSFSIGFYNPAPVYYSAPIAYYTPAPIYYAPQPVYYAPRVVHYAPRPYSYMAWNDRQWHGHDRDHDRGHHRH